MLTIYLEEEQNITEYYWFGFERDRKSRDYCQTIVVSFDVFCTHFAHRVHNDCKVHKCG